jgi:transcriptional regulator with XRE-family HTH domain
MPLPEADIFYRSIGRLVQTERINRGISQEILANQLGLTRASVINLEKGRHKPSIYQLMIIAEILQIDYNRLIPVLDEGITKTKKDIVDNLKNAVTDQDSIEKPARTAVINFLSSIKS